MRIARFGPTSNEKPCLVAADGTRYDCSAQVSDWNSSTLADLSSVADIDVTSLPKVPEDARWAAPVARPGKVLCIGLNYADHAEESGMAIPEEPIVFMKASNTVVGPYDQVLLPRGFSKADWEVELAFVVGTEARYLESPKQAAEPHRRILHLPRCQRARVPAGARRPMGEGQKLRYLLPTRPLGYHRR